MGYRDPVCGPQQTDHDLGSVRTMIPPVPEHPRRSATAGPTQGSTKTVGSSVVRLRFSQNATNDRTATRLLSQVAGLGSLVAVPTFGGTPPRPPPPCCGSPKAPTPAPSQVVRGLLIGTAPVRPQLLWRRRMTLQLQTPQCSGNTLLAYAP